MKRTTLDALYAVMLATWAVFACDTLSISSQSSTEAATIGTVRLTQAVLADGKPLAVGTYQIRLTNDQPRVAVGESPGAERWVEFMKDGKVAGREVATVVASADIGTIAKGPQPPANGSRVVNMPLPDQVTHEGRR